MDSTCFLLRVPPLPSPTFARSPKGERSPLSQSYVAEIVPPALSSAAFVSSMRLPTIVPVVNCANAGGTAPKVNIVNARTADANTVALGDFAFTAGRRPTGFDILVAVGTFAMHLRVIAQHHDGRAVLHRVVHVR